MMRSVDIDSSWLKLLHSLNESQKRWYAAQKARELGHGGVAKVHRATGLSRTTIFRGLHELRSKRKLPPPGTSKWNKIEHRMFSFISMNWKGKPLETVETVLNLIAGTRTKTGLRIETHLDEGEYKTGVKVTDETLGKVNIQSEHPEAPRSSAMELHHQSDLQQAGR